MEKEDPLVSIIIPSYNHEKFLTKRLESVFNQTYTNIEVILLDDCSKDSSRTILLEYAKHPKAKHCIFNDVNTGNTFEQWNKGIGLATGEFIWIAESDDFSELNFLEELIPQFLKDSEITLAYCQSNKVDETDNIIGNWLNHTDDIDDTLFLSNFVMDGNLYIERFLFHKNTIPNASGVVFRKSNINQWVSVDFDPKLRYCGDWLFYLKMITNKKVAYNHKKLNNFRQHANSSLVLYKKKHNTTFLETFLETLLLIHVKMRDFLKKCTELNNLTRIIKINEQFIVELKYRNASLFYKTNRKIKGIILWASILRFSINKLKIKLNKKIKKIIKYLKLTK